MSDKTYAVMGATGHIGRVIAERLLKDDHGVIVLGRSAERLKDLVAKGAKAHAGAFDDVQSLTQAFAGANGVFTMIPPDMMNPDVRAFQDRVGEAVTRAVAQSKVGHVVNLSSVGGHLPEKSGIILGLHFQENRLNALTDVNVVHLRPAFFMENLLMSIGLIRTQGILATAFLPETRLAMIATRDIGERAADLLEGLAFRDKSALELLGERDLTMPEVARILGRAVGNADLPYVSLPYDVFGAAMKESGFPPKTVAEMTGLYRGINDGIVVPAEPRSRKSSTPTSIEEFAKSVFAPAFLKEAP
jgi:uncharacterized protein YbjT (DUF2867 family)